MALESRSDANVGKIKIFGDDGSGNPAAVKVNPDGSIDVGVTLSTDTIGIATKGPLGAAEVANDGLTGRIPEVKTITLDTGPPVLTGTATPLVNNAVLVTVAGGAPGVVVVGTTATVTFVDGVTTWAAVIALWGADPAAVALGTLGGVGGVMDATGAGTYNLWSTRHMLGAQILAMPAVGDAIPVVCSNDGTLRATETSAADIKTAVEKMDDWDAVHDAAAGTDGVRAMATAYADPSVLPADVSANGDDVRAAASRKGETYVYNSRLGYGEGDTVPQLRVQARRSGGTALVATGTGVAAPCALWGLSITGLTVAGSVGIRDGGAGGTLIFTVPVTVDGVIELGSMTFAVDVHITFVAPLAATVRPLYAPTT